MCQAIECTCLNCHLQLMIQLIQFWQAAMSADIRYLMPVGAAAPSDGRPPTAAAAAAPAQQELPLPGRYGELRHTPRRIVRWLS